MLRAKLVRVVALVMLLASMSFALGCERSVEDVEKWRNAKGGMDKMVTWAKSSEEPMPVRKRALRVLIEQDEILKLQPLFDGMKDSPEKEALVSEAVVVIDEMWKKQDFPKMSDELKEKGGQVKVSGDSKAVIAKDAAYYMQPFAKGEDQKKLETILADWLAEDHKLRSQLGRTTLTQVLPRAGQKGFDGMMKWFAEQKEPAALADAIREHADDKTKERFAKVIVEKANKEHPNISKQFQVVILKTEDPVILPYLERAIKDPESDGLLADACTDAYIKIQGPKATALLNELVKTRKDLMRSVAFTRLIELRGTAGVTQAVNSLPLEAEGYATEGKYTFEKDSAYLCNVIKSELEKKDIKDIKPTIERMLSNKRWPSQVLAMRCIEQNKWADLKPKVEEFKEDKTVVPGWGEEETTVGDIAEEIAGKL